MARPSYLSRRDGGRYYLQLRLPKSAFALYGRTNMRASLRTGEFGEARRRLMDNLAWARELIEAPDLEALGAVIHGRLQDYTAAGTPDNERALAERVGFEHQARHYMARANERGYAFSQRFERFATKWVDFIDQNKAAEVELGRLDRQRDYERGRAEATTAAAKGWLPRAGAQTSLQTPETFTGPIVLSHEVHQAIDAIVTSEIGKRVGLAASPVAPALVPSASAQAAEVSTVTGAKLSQALALYLEPQGKKRRHLAKGRQDDAGTVRFAIDFLDDPVFYTITPKDWDRLDDAMTDIPNRKNIPEAHRGSLHLRYLYAQKHGWLKLLRASITTVKGYQGKMSKFVAWAIKENLYHGKAPKFECIDENNLAALPRDAFDDAELIKLISLPLFTGCANAFRVFKPGKYFLQTHIYWGYLILILTGMRPGEVGQLKCADLVSDGDNFFFDLRPYNARNGRVAIKDLRNLKTNSSGRIVPIHPLLIDLGLLDRMNELMAMGQSRLFPEWEVYERPDGGQRWSQPMTKSWQYVKTLLKISRADLTLYSTRHLMGDWLDAAGVAQRTRDRILGHASAVPGRYGRKSKIDPEQIAAIEKLEPGVVKTMREILMAAKGKAGRGELIVLKPWIKATP
jgi:integrase